MKRDWLLLASSLVLAGGAQAAGCSSDPAESSGDGGATAAGVTVSASGTGGAGGDTTSTSSGTPEEGPFTSAGEETEYEAEPHAAIDARGGVVVTWLGFASYEGKVGYSVSRNYGETWVGPSYIDAPDGRLSNAPVVAVDSEGAFFLAWAGFRVDDPAVKDEHVYVSKLDPIGETFGAPVLASDDGSDTNLDFDKPWITIDASDDRLLTWADFTDSDVGQKPALTFARTHDGATFTRSTIVDDDTFGNLAYPCLDRTKGNSAPLYVVHLGAGGTLTLRASQNGGTDWQSHDVPAASVVFQDPRCVVSGDDVWISYASGAALFTPGQTSPADAVQIVHSGNGGQSFDAPVTVSDGAAGTQYLFPQLARTSDGKLEMIYYQGKVGQPGKLARASSADGVAWTSVMVAETGTFSVDRTTPDWLGDYMGLAQAGTTLFAAYADNSSGKAHIQISRLQL